MFRPDKEDGLFTLDSVFIAIKESSFFLVTFEDQTDIKKGVKVWNIELSKWMPIELASLPNMPWKKGNDAIRAKDVYKVRLFFEELGFDFFFWHETMKEEKNFENMKNFYLQRIKLNVEKELRKQ